MGRLRRNERASASTSPSAIDDQAPDEQEGNVGGGGEARALLDEGIEVSETGIRVDRNDPANVQRSKTHDGWWLPEDVSSWWQIPEPQAGEPTKERPLTVQQLMRRERELHLYGRGAGGKHVPDHAPRLLALAVDGLIGVAIMFAYKVLVGYPFVGDPLRPAWGLIGVLVAVQVVPVVMWRASLGKLVFGLRIVRVDGSECSVVRALARLLIPPLAIFDAILVIATPHRRRAIDYLLRTRVVANG